MRGQIWQLRWHEAVREERGGAAMETRLMLFWLQGYSLSPVVRVRLFPEEIVYA